MGDDTSRPDLGRLYLDTHARLAALIAGLDQAALATPVPACPGWPVRDVLAHLVAITEDALAGRLTGPPDEAWTAAQVARFAGTDAAGLLAIWARTCGCWWRTASTWPARAGAAH